MTPTARFHAATLLVLAILAPGCGGKSSSSPASPTPPSFNGNWRGTTGQNLPITFTVADNTITAISVDIRATYLSSSCTYTTGSSQRPAIANNTFTLPIGGGTVTTTLTGTFASSTAANGTIAAFSISGLLCGSVFVIGTPVNQASQTWQATRQ